MSRLPSPRGPISHGLFRALTQPPDSPLPRPEPAWGRDDALVDEDLQLALYCCYELHYRGFDGVDEGWEWTPALLALRAELEARFDAALLEAVAAVAEVPPPEEFDLALRVIADSDDGPPLSRFVAHSATLEQVRELMIHRSAYQLKEADPHSWAIARLSGRPKAALVEIQADEYGGGRAHRIHAELFAQTMRHLGLDATYGAYLDRIPAVTLATVNLMSLFGLHRRRRGALVGHLALFEMTSSLPNRRYGAGLRRLGLGPEATDFFDEHVTADAVHEQIAAVDLAGGLAAQEPALGSDILWGARALAELDRRFAGALLTAWEQGGSLLLGGRSRVLAA